LPAHIPSLPAADVIRRALGEFQITVNDQQVTQIQQYMKTLLAWNDKVNLTAIRDPIEILYRHFCESMYAAPAVAIRNGRLADIGSGGGFPGLPMKILVPELEVFLVESNVKKATFLAEVIRDMRLEGTRVLVSRYEELSEELAPLDFVCCRAVGEFAAFLRWAGSRELAAKRAVLWLGGRDIDEVNAIGGWSWHKPMAIPHSLRRYLLLGERIEDAPGL
jgi:16S rRNA (guanine527-N7)-methyltransferase